MSHTVPFAALCILCGVALASCNKTDKAVPQNTNATKSQKKGGFPTWVYHHSSLVQFNKAGQPVSLGIDSSRFNDIQMCEICKFTTLEYLHLYTPSVSAEAMKSLKGLRRLRDVTFVDRAPVDSELIKELGSLPQLREVGFEDRQVDGPLISELANIKSLQSLRLGRCTLPRGALSGLEKCVQLESVTIAGCKIEDGDWKFPLRMNKLRELRVEVTPVSSTTMKALRECTSMRKLDLRGCELDDTAVSILGSLTSLDDLHLNASFSGFSDSNMQEIFRLSNLHTLTLFPGDEATSAGLVGIEGLEGLRDLCLGGSGIAFDADDLRRVARLEKLTRLKLQFTRIDDAGVAQLLRLKNLKTLDLRDTKVTRRSFQHFKDMKALTDLLLHGCPISDEDLAELNKALPHVDVSF